LSSTLLLTNNNVSQSQTILSHFDTLKMPNILVIGATRGLGASIANAYASQPSTTVFGTTRSTHGPKDGKLNEKIVWVPHVDVSEEGVGRKLVNQLGMLGGGGGMNEGGVRGFDVVVSESIVEEGMR
jgi:NAD(P)-dependent dehydrogenase (short-subunit alcohol dehydrogenase family)